MGWNQGYEIFEATVIGAYDLGKLDKKLLAVLAAPYKNTDIDAGGRTDLLTKDGKDIDRVVIEVGGGVMPVKPEKSYDDDPVGWEDYHEKLCEEFYKIVQWR